MKGSDDKVMLEAEVMRMVEVEVSFRKATSYHTLGSR